MNSNNLRGMQLRGLVVWLVALLLLVGIGSIVPKWLVNLIFVLIGLAFLAPVVGFLGLRWWLQRNLIEDACPVCGAPLSGLKTLQIQCPSCGTPLQVSNGKLQRINPPGTIDVDVVDVSAQVIESQILDSQVVDSPFSED